VARRSSVRRDSIAFPGKASASAAKQRAGAAGRSDCRATCNARTGSAVCESRLCAVRLRLCVCASTVSGRRTDEAEEAEDATDPHTATDEAAATAADEAAATATVLSAAAAGRWTADIAARDSRSGVLDRSQPHATAFAHGSRQHGAPRYRGTE